MKEKTHLEKLKRKILLEESKMKKEHLWSMVMDWTCDAILKDIDEIPLDKLHMPYIDDPKLHDKHAGEIKMIIKELIKRGTK